ncbi:MAG: putative internal virion protein [Prokaryotic dsDNA virus sp.]|nr:MAG: putative internal virion protein [Prokaryotic dsDNA virus sp.]|tara:strand:+ start:8559 stop:9134 length:576 start_codon:yes stop_codon:yes gene_type:complete
MCPVTIGLGLGASQAAAAGVGAAAISSAMGVATTALSIRGQQQAAKAQARAQEMQTKAEQQRLLQQQAAERINQRFQEEQAADQLQKSATKAREARATARVSAGESGVAGRSVDALMNDLTRKQAVYRFGLTRQLEQSNIATELRLQDQGMASQQRLLAINKPIEQPNYLEGILKGATTGLNAYGSLNTTS